MTTANAVVSIAPVDTMTGARALWTELADEQDNLFATWEWGSTWWATFGGGRQLAVRAVSRDGRLIGLLPVYVAESRLGGIGRFIGHGPADQLGAVCRPEDRRVVARALNGALASGDFPEIVLAERLRGDEGWAAALGSRPIRSESYAVVDLEGLDWEAWLARRSGHFRHHVRGTERRLVREHGLEFELVDGGTATSAALDDVIRLHEARWAGTSTAFAGRRRAFHHAFARAAAERRWLRIWFAVIHGQRVAAVVCFRFGGSEWGYQMGRDPAWERWSVGSVLLLHTIRAAADEGVREYRLLRGDESYKGRLATRDPGVDTYLLGRSAIGVAARQLVHHRQHVPAFVRRTVAARLGL